LYVAATVFRESGVGYSYNVVTQTLVLYNSSRSLVFDVATGSATDGQGDTYDHVCVTRSGVTFVAVSPVATYFDRVYTNTPVNHGYLIRVNSASAALGDQLFIDAANYQLVSKYQAYIKSTAPPTPDKPVSQVPPTIQADDEEEPMEGKNLYLCFLITDPEKGFDFADALEVRGAHAAFYFTRESLEQSGDLLRRLASSGNAVGLMSLTGGLREFDEMNQVLFRLAGMKTRLVYRPGGDGNTLRAGGYVPLRPGVDRTKYGLISAAGAKTILTQAGSRRGAVSVWLGEQVNLNGLHSFFLAAAEEKDRLLAITELV
jgi:hypothetical protein